MSLSKLVEISNKYGANPEFVLAGGGNTSYKDETYLYIKGSGTTLATITEEGFVKMNRQKLADMFTKQYSEDSAEREMQVLQDMMDAREQTELNKRPSVETLLHNLIAYRYIVHTHPSMLNGMTCGVKGKEIAQELFGNSSIWIDIIEPGYVLAAKLKEEMDLYKKEVGKDADIIFLQNHGVFIAADTPEEIDEKTKEVFSKISSKIKRQPDFEPVDVSKETIDIIKANVEEVLKYAHKSETSHVEFCANKEVLRFMKDDESFYPISSAYSPDHIVYCKPFPLLVSKEMDLEKAVNEYQDKYGFAPKVIAVRGIGYFAWGTNEKNAATCAEVFLDTCKIGVYSEGFGGPLFMTPYMIDFICNWEVEAYRSKVSQG